MELGQCQARGTMKQHSAFSWAEMHPLPQSTKTWQGWQEAGTVHHREDTENQNWVLLWRPGHVELRLGGLGADAEGLDLALA